MGCFAACSALLDSRLLFPLPEFTFRQSISSSSSSAVEMGRFPDNSRVDVNGPFAACCHIHFLAHTCRQLARSRICPHSPLPFARCFCYLRLLLNLYAFARGFAAARFDIHFLPSLLGSRLHRRAPQPPPLALPDYTFLDSTPLEGFVRWLIWIHSISCYFFWHHFHRSSDSIFEILCSQLHWISREEESGRLCFSLSFSFDVASLFLFSFLQIATLSSWILESVLLTNFQPHWFPLWLCSGSFVAAS